MATRSRVAPARPGDVLLLVGTTKGAFVLHANRARTRWSVGAPAFRGFSVYAMAYDDRGGRQRLWAATRSEHWGAVLCSSDDFGATWTEPEASTLKFPAESGLSLRGIWQIALGPRTEPDVLYCGVEPAALFESRDAGATWAPVRGLLDHPHRERWQPGGGGLCLHTIVTDPEHPERMVIAISTGGVYRTDDGGRSWQARNAGVRAQFLPDKYPEFGQCVHKVVRDPSQPGRLYLQNHWGLYRSDDWGDSWHDVANRVPSDFGFAMAAHPRAKGTVYILPLESDMFRCVPEAKLRVYRTRDGGASWEPLARGLPQKGAYETVLRDAMTTDALDPAGVYFGTRNGKLFGSRNEGGSWQLIADGLPPIVCVKAAVVGGAARSSVSAVKKARTVKKTSAKKAAAKGAAPKRARRARRRS